MSYMRGDWYVWGDGFRTHVWPRKPEADVTEWATSCDFVAGVAIPDGLLDELVVMRAAELERDGKLDQVRKRAVRKWGGNVGCVALVMAVKGFTLDQYVAWSDRRVARYLKKHPVSA